MEKCFCYYPRALVLCGPISYGPWGADLIFGVEWLKHMGPITTEYSSLTMSFNWGNELVKLRGCTGPSPTEETPGLVKHMLHINGVATFFQLQLCASSDNPYEPSTILLPSQLQLLLNIYSPIFQQPTTLPPQWTIDHTIHLIPNSQPVNVKPYRYPYFQKQEIEKQIEEMVHRNHI